MKDELYTISLQTQGKMYESVKRFKINLPQTNV